MSKLYVNIDANTVVQPFLERLNNRDDFCPEMLYPMVDMYRPLGVTDLLFNIFVQVSATRSDVWTDFVDKYHTKEELGKAVDYTERYEYIYTFDKYGVDYVKVWVERCKEVGINPWISIRMNDCHWSFTETSVMRSEFYYEALEKGWVLGDEYGYYRICFNYKIPEVREKMLSYIREQLLRYDVYGLELDYLREVKYFRDMTDNLEECLSAMTEFISSVRELTKEISLIHGHEIKLLVRLPRDLEQCKKLGFDAEVWAERKLVDVIVPSPRFSSNDSGMPMEEWKTRITNAEVCSGLETMMSLAKNSSISSTEICTGLAASYLAQGSDGMYLYNLFCDPDNLCEPSIHPYVRNVKTILALSDSEKIYDYPMRIPVINQEDFYLPGIAWTPMPLKISDRNSKEFSIVTGKIPEKKLVSVVVGYKGTLPSVSINGCECANGKPIDLTLIPGIGVQPKDYVDNDTVCLRFIVDNSVLDEYSQKLTFESENECSIEWIEIDVV